ncbi:MAG: hypothetical protein BGN86_09615 [Caulobacterales bacterium 68-7]|nr:DUF2490 domain-containing protein [Caulobacterales bacterium]OJU11003.1 MAG: hypothetical protein BGN86_09615 [Caulobacterales bacterium 68-7]
MLRALVLAAAGLCLTLATPALADDHDRQAWGNVTYQGPVNGKLMLWLEGQGRFGDNAGRLTQSIIRPGVGWQVAPRLSLWAGYGRITNHNPGNNQSEDRLWQQALWNVGKLGDAAITSRTRLEQRQVEGGDDTGWRVRQFLKYDRPFTPGAAPGGAAPSLVLTSEAFFALDDTDWGARSGFDQIRNFAGVGFSVAPKARFEIGYMNQYINRAGDNDRMNHIASVNLFGRF